MHFTRTDSIKFFIYILLFFFLFVGYNKASSPYFETTFDSASITSKETPIQEQVPVIQEKEKKKLTKKPILTIAFNPDYVQIDPKILVCLREVIASPFFKSKVTPLNLVIDAERQEPRGQVMGNKLILATSVSDDSERLKVFVHELGHIVDIFYLKKDILSADPSDRFYEISWDSYNTKKKEMKIPDFVSGYSLSNKYEDFAESFAFYIFHNEDFARLASENGILQQKYDFLRSYVFGKEEFIGTHFEEEDIKAYNWDTTKIPVNTKKYLYYVR